MKKILLTLTLLFSFLLAQAQQPALTWAKNMGGSAGDFGYAIAVDATGNVYTTGYFQGTADFDPSGGIFNLTSAGLKDIFISKTDASGNFVWAKSIGGRSLDMSRSIKADASGNIYIAGYFNDTVDFNPRYKYS